MRWIHPDIPVVGEAGPRKVDLEIQGHCRLERREWQHDCADGRELAGGQRLRREVSAGNPLAANLAEAPADLRFGQVARAEVGDFDGGPERFVTGPDAFGQAGEGNGFVAEPTILSRFEVAFLVPESIEHADQRGALPGEIVQVEQLKARPAGRAQAGFDLVFVEQRLEPAGGAQEILGLAEQARFVHEIADDLEIPGLEQAAVFRDLVEVGEHAILADLVADDGAGALVEEGAIIAVGAALRGGVHRVGARLGGDVDVVFGNAGPAGPGGVEAARVLLFPEVHEPGEELFVVRTAGFVAGDEEQEGGVVTVGGDDAFAFVVDPLIQRRALIEVRRPRRALDLEVKPHFVSGDEGGLGGAPRVKAEMIEAVLAGDAENAFPRRDVGGRVTVFGEDATLERAAEKDLPAIQNELFVRDGDIAQAECDAVRGGDARHFQGELVQRGIELIPEWRVGTEFVSEVHVPAVGSPLDGQLERRRAGRFCGQLKLRAEALSGPLPGWPVALPSLTSTRTCRLAAFGKTRTSANQRGSVASSSSRPATPFQLPWVWSVMLWASAPTAMSSRLSTRSVS